MEDYIEKHGGEVSWDVDDAMKEHLQSLGLWQEEVDPTDGSQYISENYKPNEKQD